MSIKIFSRTSIFDPMGNKIQEYRNLQPLANIQGLNLPFPFVNVVYDVSVTEVNFDIPPGTPGRYQKIGGAEISNNVHFDNEMVVTGGKQVETPAQGSFVNQILDMMSDDKLPKAIQNMKETSKAFKGFLDS